MVQWLIATAWEMGVLSMKTGYLEDGSIFFDFAVLLLEKFPDQTEEQSEISAKVHVGFHNFNHSNFPSQSR